MMQLRDWSVGNRVAFGIASMVMLAVGTRLHAMRRIASDGDVATTERIVLPALPTALGPSGDSLAHVIAVAVSADLFQPRRTRPAVRFRARSSHEEAPPSDSTALPAATQPAAVVALQGIAHLANGNALAVLSVGGGTAQLLRVGQSLDQYRLVRVDSSSATLVGADSTIILHLRDVARTNKP